MLVTHVTLYPDEDGVCILEQNTSPTPDDDSVCTLEQNTSPTPDDDGVCTLRCLLFHRKETGNTP